MGALGGGLSLGTLSITIEAAVSEAIAEIQRFGADVGKVLDDQKSKWEGLQQLGQGLSSFGTTLTAAVTAPLVAIGALSLKAAGDFEQSMNKIVAVSQPTETELEAMRQQALKLGADTKYSAGEAAEGMGNLAAAGFNASQTMAAMPGVLDLAAAGTLAVERAAEVTTDTLGQFGLAAGSAGQVADIFAAGAAASAISAEQLAQSMKLVGPVANLAGMSLAQTTTAIALLGNEGIKATEAGTGLRGVLAALESPSRKAQAALDALGVSTKDVHGNLLPLDQIMLQLKTSGAGASDMFTIFGRESSAAAAALMKDSGPAWAAMTAEIDKSEGAAKRMADTLNSGLNGSMEQLKGSVETAAIALGTALTPVIQALLGVATKVVNDFLLPAIQWFGNLPAPIQGAIGALVGLAAALGPVLLIAGQLAIAIAALGPVMVPIGAACAALGLSFGGVAIAVGVLVAALAALGVWVYQNWFGIMSAIESGVDAVVRKIAAFVGFLQQVVPATSAAGVALAAAKQGLSDYSKELETSAGKHKGMQDALEATKKKHDEAAAAAKAHGKDEKGAGEDAKTAAGKHDGLKTKLSNLSDQHGKTGASAKTLKGHIKDAGDAAKEAEDKFKKLQERNEILDAKAQILAATHKKQATEIAGAQLAAENLGRNLESGLGPAIDALNTKSTKWLDTFTELGTTGIPKVLEKAALIKPTIEPATGSIAAMDEGLKALGITSAAKFQQVANDAQTAYDKVIAAPQATQWERDSALLKLLEAQRQAVIAAGKDFPAETEAMMTAIKNKVEAKAPDVQSSFDGMFSNVSTVITNFAQDVSKSLWEGDTSWGEKGKKLLTSLGEAVTSSFIEPAAKAISKFITTELADLIGSKGLAGVWDAVKGLGSAIGDLFKGGASVAGGAASAAGGAASAAGGAASAAGGAASGVGSAASGIMSGALGWASLGTSIVSGVVSFFQGSETNKTLDKVVLHTLQTANDLFNLRRDDWDRHSEYAKWKDDFLAALWDIKDHTNDAKNTLDSIAPDLARASDALAGMLGDSRAMAGAQRDWMDSVVALLTKAVTGLEKISTAQAMQMNLYGTDPSLVAGQIATRLRIQGGVA